MHKKTFLCRSFALLIVQGAAAYRLTLIRLEASAYGYYAGRSRNLCWLATAVKVPTECVLLSIAWALALGS